VLRSSEAGLASSSAAAEAASVGTKAEEYRRKAAEAEASAASTQDLSARPMYWEIAAYYRYLAEQRDLMDVDATPPKTA
jgi:hypothetical protein